MVTVLPTVFRISLTNSAHFVGRSAGVLLLDAGLSDCCLQAFQSWLQLVLFAYGCSSLWASSGYPRQMRCQSSLQDQEPSYSQCSTGKTENTSYCSSHTAAGTRSLQRLKLASAHSLRACRLHAHLVHSC